MKKKVIDKLKNNSDDQHDPVKIGSGRQHEQTAQIDEQRYLFHAVRGGHTGDSRNLQHYKHQYF